MVDSLEFLVVVAHGAQGVNKSLGVHLEQPLFVVRDIRHWIAARKTFCVAGNQPADFLVQCLLRLVQDLIDDRTWEPYRIHAAPHTGQAGSLRSLSSRRSIVSTSSSSTRPVSV